MKDCRIIIQSFNDNQGLTGSISVYPASFEDLMEVAKQEFKDWKPGKRKKIRVIKKNKLIYEYQNFR